MGAGNNSERLQFTAGKVRKATHKGHPGITKNPDSLPSASILFYPINHITGIFGVSIMFCDAPSDSALLQIQPLIGNNSTCIFKLWALKTQAWASCDLCYSICSLFSKQFQKPGVFFRQFCFIFSFPSLWLHPLIPQCNCVSFPHLKFTN